MPSWESLNILTRRIFYLTTYTISITLFAFIKLSILLLYAANCIILLLLTNKVRNKNNQSSLEINLKSFVGVLIGNSTLIIFCME